MKKPMKIFIGVAWPYVNGPLHIGHLAGAYLAADIFARFQRLVGREVLMVSGSDMHGTPIMVEAEKAKVAPIDFATKYHQLDKKVFKKLGISFDLYTQTSTKNHKNVVQEIFLTLLKKNYLFKKKVNQFFCPRCQRFLPDRFVEGKCPFCGYLSARGDQCDACGRTLDPTELTSPLCKTCRSSPILRESEQFFLVLPQFARGLKNWIKKQTHWRKNVFKTSLGWLEEGLKPRAVTRDLDYGIPLPLPKFKTKVIYVWFEAVVGYLSASKEWAKKRGKPESFRRFWLNPECRHYYFMGKDNIPFHTIIWPAILMGFNQRLNLPYDIVANQYLNVKGEKLSKSRGNLITVEELLGKYSVDAVRFYFTYNMPENRDTDFSQESFVKQNNSILVATLGNFINRSLVFIKRYFGEIKGGRLEEEVARKITSCFQKTGEEISQCHFQKGLREIVALGEFANLYFDKNQPWERIKGDKEAVKNTLYNCAQIIFSLSTLLEPFLPHAAGRLRRQLGIKGSLRWEFREVRRVKLNKIIPLFPKY